MKRLLVIALAGSILGAAPVEDKVSPVLQFEQLIKGNRLLEAQAALESYTALHPDSWQAQYQLGYVYFQLHRIQPSVDRLCKSLVINEKFPESHKILAFDLNILGDSTRAVVELERLLQLDPNSAEGHYELGRIYYERGSYIQSVRHLEAAKALNPASVRVYHNLGLSYAAVSDTARAEENFEEGLRRNAQAPKPSPWPLIDYGTYLNMRSEYAKARDLLVQSVAIDGRWDQAFSELSKAYRALGQIESAIDALNHAVALNSGKPEYHYILSQLYRQKQLPREADQQMSLYRTSRSASLPAR